VHAPLLIIHGESNTFIDIDKNSQVIYDNTNKPKVFIRVAGVNHTDIPEKMGKHQYLFTVLISFSIHLMKRRKNAREINQEELS
jgi:hypothetical protein